jgi:sugar/nucleoside kinase (ribokinase family)
MNYLSLGGIILDDVVFPDGRTAMNRLGGGGLYAAAGMRVWSAQVGLLARVGPDFDFGLLAEIGLDRRAIQVTERPTPRAWQLYEEDGKRTQIPRVSPGDWQAQLRPTPDLLRYVEPPRGLHMIGRGHEIEPELAKTLAQAGVTLSLEPIIEEGLTERERKTVLDTLAFVDIFSPGLAEARLLMGERPLRELLLACAELGPRCIALRRGAAGSLVYDRLAGRFWQVPAARARVVDVTGAGNAYCGGFLVGWIEDHKIESAAACAAVSAAVTIEQLGPPAPTPALLAEAEWRRAACLAEIQDVTEQMI